jgi:anti-sigma factor RsiW
MYCKQYREAIQELADGTLGPVRRAELQTHLDQCDDCRALAADLRKIREAAASLDDQAPSDRVWQGIAAQLQKEGRVTAAPPRRRHMALLALAAGLVLAVGGSLYLLLPLRGTTVPVARDGGAPGSDPQAGSTGDAARGNAVTTPTVQSIADDFRIAEQHYQSAITKLEQVTAANDGTIDPQTSAVIQNNLKVINNAIADSREALKSDPQSTVARESLFDALRHKVALLQDTIALMNEMRKGNSAGAAQIIQGGNKS